MEIFAGTSGFSYAEWCGRFYPVALPGAQMLSFYCQRLPTVEINNTFYRMPTQEVVAAWGAEVPKTFRFAIKATRRITHQQKLADVGDEVAHLFDVIGVLGQKLGPVLFQLPPFLKKDLGLLTAFLRILPAGKRAALEFRHPSWFTDDVYAALAECNVALVGGDLEEADNSPPLVATADFGYLRLRRLDYEPSGLEDWSTQIRAQSWKSAYVYLKHEVLGPMFAEALLANLSGCEMADLSAIRASIVAPKPKSTRASSSKSNSPEARASSTPGPRTTKYPGAHATKAPSARPTKARTGTSKAPVAPPSKAPGKPRKA